MSKDLQSVLQQALRLSGDEQVLLREALEEAEVSVKDSIYLPRVAGLNRNDPCVLQDLNVALLEEYLGELP